MLLGSGVCRAADQGMEGEVLLGAELACQEASLPGPGQHCQPGPAPPCPWMLSEVLQGSSGHTGPPPPVPARSVRAGDLAWGQR